MSKDALENDDRTTALGLLGYAHSYWVCASGINPSSIVASHPMAPILYLYVHAIELYLKAFLRNAGCSVSEIRGLSHGLKKLDEHAIRRGLPYSQLRTEVIKLAGPIHTSLRYIQTGPQQHPSLQDLWGVCIELHSTVEPLVHQAANLRRSRGVEMSDFGKDLIQSMQEAVDHLSGTGSAIVHTPVNPKDIRKRAKLTQEQMAPLMGMSVSGYRKWEQGSRQISGPALTLLRVLDRNPKAVIDAVSAG